MLHFNIKEWMSLGVLRAHLCTVGVAMGLHATWRSPRDAFRHGGLQYGLVFTIAMISVALPLSLLQLAVGQLSQQDAVGIWRAVPFFRGVGYLRLLISFLGAVYSVIYLSLTISYFLYTLSNNSLPFWECIDLFLTEDDYMRSHNASECINETFMAPISDRPEYFLAVALILLVLWIVLPFIFYHPVKLMKRIMFTLGPTVIILAIVTVSCIGNSENLSSFVSKSHWKSFVEPHIWHGALAQALLSSQIAGGFLISSGDTIYSNTNVQWTAIIFVGANIVSTWFGLLFWYSLSGPDKETNVLAVLIQAYKVGEEYNMHLAWPLLIFLTLLLSGFISLLTLVFPIYDRFRRISGLRWRLVSVAASVAGAAMSLGALAVRIPALTLMDDYAVPLLASLATVLELLAFVFVYGWKVLLEDVEFLTGHELAKCWVLGWCAAPGIITPFTVWWITVAFVNDDDWMQPPWASVTLISTMTTAILVFFICSLVVVARQVQYDFLGKLKSSFKPSRHWGPRDPITHYYWLARRDELERGNVPTRYHRRQLGVLSVRPRFLHPTHFHPIKNSSVDKSRSNSDDMIYTVYRKKVQGTVKDDASKRVRSNSLDWTFPKMKPKIDLNCSSFSSIKRLENNNNAVDIDNNDKTRI